MDHSMECAKKWQSQMVAEDGAEPRSTFLGTLVKVQLLLTELRLDGRSFSTAASLTADRLDVLMVARLQQHTIRVVGTGCC
jgi:hypothetical protein